MNKFETRYILALLMFFIGTAFGVILSIVQATVSAFLLFSMINAIIILFVVSIFETIMAGKPDDD